ncbi:MAG: hypothetical protein ILA34_00755 [Bacteroidaceae bacterium]|nr:hypothetical protein [Bacteroidaceae bacterium]
MKKVFFFLLAAIPVLGMAQKIDYKKVNAQALREYQRPVRPGTNGENPFWNGFARKFMYAPAFDFPEKDGAREYVFEISDAQGRMWQMKARSPKADLSPVWQQIPGGTDVTLRVYAVDRQGGKDATPLGERKFLRDFPFQGPYNTAARPYKEAALKAMLYVHRMKTIRHWEKNQTPNLGYKYNTYACKIMAATIRNECMVARYFPEERETAIQMARNVAAYLKSMSQPGGSPLAGFPPTYINGVLGSAEINPAEAVATTMCLEALPVAWSLLDLYNETKDRQYYDWALGIADTYLRLQRADGSLPIKVKVPSGEPVNESNAMLYPLVCLTDRLHSEYGIEKYEGMRLKAEQWMRDVAIRSFNMTGQFEDVSVLNLKPYENLTNCTAAPYADYLYSHKESTAADLRDADDLMRLSEDQFTFWNMRPQANGIRQHTTPCVFEQYKYQMSVDNSACNVAGGFLAKYERTGDLLSLAKAIALTNSITAVQNVCTGQIPTTWEQRTNVDAALSFWINCQVSSINMLLRMDEALRGKSSFRFIC